MFLMSLNNSKVSLICRNIVLVKFAHFLILHLNAINIFCLKLYFQLIIIQ